MVNMYTTQILSHLCRLSQSLEGTGHHHHRTILSRFSRVPLCNTMDCSPPGSPVHGDSPDENTGVGCHFFLKGSSQPRD